MMVLYSGTTCPFSQRCRLVLFEKGMDFEIRDVDLFNKPEDISVMNPYGQVPILVERDLILYESNIINEYIDERFPHPQLMPADRAARACAPVPAELREGTVRSRQHAREREGQGSGEESREGASCDPRSPDAACADLREEQVHARRGVLDARRRDRAAAVASGSLRHRAVEERCAADEVCRADLQPSRVYRSTDAVRKGHASLMVQ
jgi:glutathione S-transferase